MNVERLRHMAISGGLATKRSADPGYYAAIGRMGGRAGRGSVKKRRKAAPVVRPAATPITLARALDELDGVVE